MDLNNTYPVREIDLQEMLNTQVKNNSQICALVFELIENAAMKIMHFNCQILGYGRGMPYPSYCNLSYNDFYALMDEHYRKTWLSQLYSTGTFETMPEYYQEKTLVTEKPLKSRNRKEKGWLARTKEKLYIVKSNTRPFPVYLVVTIELLNPYSGIAPCFFRPKIVDQYGSCVQNLTKSLARKATIATTNDARFPINSKTAEGKSLNIRLFSLTADQLSESEILEELSDLEDISKIRARKRDITNKFKPYFHPGLNPLTLSMYLRIMGLC